MLVSHDWGAIIGSVFVAHYPDMVQKYILMGAAPRKVFKQLYEQTADQRNKSSYIVTFLKPGVAESEFQANDFARFSTIYKTEDVDVYKYVYSQPGTKKISLSLHIISERPRLKKITFEMFNRCINICLKLLSCQYFAEEWKTWLIEARW